MKMYNTNCLKMGSDEKKRIITKVVVCEPIKDKNKQDILL